MNPSGVTILRAPSNLLHRRLLDTGKKLHQEVEQRGDSEVHPNPAPTLSNGQSAGFGGAYFIAEFSVTFLGLVGEKATDSYTSPAKDRDQEWYLHFIA